MRILNSKSKVSIIALILALTIAATLITAIPFTLGQTIAKIPCDTNVNGVPYIVGLNQEIFLAGVISPRPLGYQQEHALSQKNIFYDLTFVIDRPDGTQENITMDSNDRGEAWFWYTCTQLGRYYLRLWWPGDAEHQPNTLNPYCGVFQWTVVEDPQPLLEKITPMAFLDVIPEKVGTGEIVAIIGWVSPPRALHRGILYDYEFTVTKPDGTTITHVTDSDSPATAYMAVVCDQAGTWSAKLRYPGNNVYNSAESPVSTWTVEDGYVQPTYTQEPLPTGQWKWPISAEYQEWYQISGPWKQSRYDQSGSSFNPYSKAPSTPHVLWAMVDAIAGQMGGETGYFSWTPRFSTMISAGGRLYYTKGETVTGGGGDSTATHPVLYCLDLFTGELIYRSDLPGRGSGGNPILVMDQRFKSDPALGAREFSSYSIWLISGGLWQIDPSNGQCSYYNPDLSGSALYDGAIYMNNYPMESNWTKWDINTRSIVWTTSVPWKEGWGGRSGQTYTFPRMMWEDIGVASTHEHGGVPQGTREQTWNLTTGEILVDFVDVGYSTTMGAQTAGEGQVWVHIMDMTTVAMDMYTGQIVWKSEPQEYPWGDFSAYTAAYSYGPTGGNGQVYIPSYDGYLYAYDIATGATNWKGYMGDSLGETGPGHFMPWAQAITADSKVYVSVAEHTTPNPQPRGGGLYCFDANTGETIWRLGGFYSGGTSNGGVSSGILWYPNRYDGRLYFFGKGPSATTVSATPKVAAKGSSVLIEGTVTDESPGSPGTPAVSDDSQEQWVQYLYMNKPMPTDATGVPVLLQAMSSDYNVIDIAHVTTDIMGHYEYLWTPPDEDTYKILATFEGSDSYWMSAAETALGVTAAPSPAGPIEPEEPEPAAGLITTEVAIIAVVIVAAVIGIVAYWALRKRK